MIKTVIKRDGTPAHFRIEKIYGALDKAFASKGMETPVEVYDFIKDWVDHIEEESMHVEDIQDKLEKYLMKYYPCVAKNFIIWRAEHKAMREEKSKQEKEVEKTLKAENVKNQNANLDEKSFGGMQGEVMRMVLKDYALKNCMCRKSRNNHLNNEIYIHDLDSYAAGMHNCLSIPFDDLLANGFYTRQTDVRPAKSINTAMQLVAVIFQLQSLQQFGGVSATHLDWTMAPYVKKSFFKHYIQRYLEDCPEFLDLDVEKMIFSDYDEEIIGDDGKKYIVSHNAFDDWCDEHRDEMLEKLGFTQDDFYFDNKKLNPAYVQSAKKNTLIELKQAVEGMYHNLNTLQSRSGNQLPFTSINYGTCTLPEGRVVTKALLQGSIKGVGKFHKTPIFPCGIFQYMKGVNDRPGTPNYDLFQMALQSTAKRLYPNYANVDWSGNAGYDINDPCTYFSTMGCRTANGWDINGLGQRKDGRGNICPVTIIMPTLAMEADRNVEKFMKLLDKKIEEAKDMLIERFEWICSKSPNAADFMYINHTMAGYIPEEGIRSALKHGTLVIGQLGLAETLQLLIGKNHTTEEGMELAKRIEQLFKDRCAEYKKKYSLNFGVYYTPAENLCYTALKKFRDKYGVIENVSDREYFTNSMHVPVWEKVTPFEKIDIESQLTGYSSAGCITYVELPSTVLHNLEALETIVNYAMDHDLPYFAVNTPNDICMDCGYQGEIGETCPRCGSSKIHKLRRVTGYLTGDYKTAFNLGKQDEVKDRVKHNKELIV